MERAFSKNIELPLLVPRLDANDIPKGKNPLFSFNNNKLVLKNNISIGSNWFKT